MANGTSDNTKQDTTAQTPRGLAQSFEGTIAAIDRDQLGVVVTITKPTGARTKLGYARLDDHGTQHLTRKVVARLRKGDQVKGLVLPSQRGYARITSLELRA